MPVIIPNFLFIKWNLTYQGIGILETSDINQGGWYRIFFSDLLFIRGGNHRFFKYFIFRQSFTFLKPTFSIEFFGIDRSYVYLVIKLILI
jgi:hypothetical protein